jgi:hypothetical protein
MVADVARNISSEAGQIMARTPGASKHGGQARDWSISSRIYKLPGGNIARTAGGHARAWWFAQEPKPQRSGKVSSAWEFRTDNVTFIIENRNPRASFVYSFAETLRPRGGRPNPGHIRTGWPQQGKKNADETMSLFARKYRDMWRNTFSASIRAGRFVRSNR